MLTFAELLEEILTLQAKMQAKQEMWTSHLSSLAPYPPDITASSPQYLSVTLKQRLNTIRERLELYNKHLGAAHRIADPLFDLCTRLTVYDLIPDDFDDERLTGTETATSFLHRLLHGWEETLREYEVSLSAAEKTFTYALSLAVMTGEKALSTGRAFSDKIKEWPSVCPARGIVARDYVLRLEVATAATQASMAAIGFAIPRQTRMWEFMRLRKSADDADQGSADMTLEEITENMEALRQQRTGEGHDGMFEVDESCAKCMRDSREHEGDGVAVRLSKRQRTITEYFPHADEDGDRPSKRRKLA